MGFQSSTAAPDGQVRTAYVRLVDFDHPGNNDWLAVNQVMIVQNKNRRPDVLVFVNGIPLALLELKNPANEHATLKTAWNQVQTYRADIPAVFTPNAVTVISDGTSAAMSSFSGGFEHYAPWKTIDGRDVITNRPALEVLLKGAFEPIRLLDLITQFRPLLRRATWPGQAGREVPPVLGRQRRGRIHGCGRK